MTWSAGGPRVLEAPNEEIRRYRGINGPVRPGDDVDAAEHDRPEDGKPE